MKELRVGKNYFSNFKMVLAYIGAKLVYALNQSSGIHRVLKNFGKICRGVGLRKLIVIGIMCFKNK